MIAINGFGRIGRTFLRTVLSHTGRQLPISCINGGGADPIRLAHLFKYDSTMGSWPEEVFFADDFLHVGSQKIRFISQMNPLACPWQALGIEWVVEASGAFTSRTGAHKHLTAGARRVLISAPSGDADRLIIQGVNHADYQPLTDHIVSLGSCTTNSIAPIVEVMKRLCTIESLMITTVHAYTNDQRLLDGDHEDLRRARAAADNIIPTKTGAGSALVALYPALNDRIHALAVRVPVSNVSLVDCVFATATPLAPQTVNRALAAAAAGPLQGILAISNLPLVSRDFQGHRASAIVDTALTAVCGNQVKICAWYDNEQGYCVRMLEFLLHNTGVLG